MIPAAAAPALPPTDGEQVCVRFENEPEALFTVVPAEGGGLALVFAAPGVSDEAYGFDPSEDEWRHPVEAGQEEDDKNDDGEGEAEERERAEEDGVRTAPAPSASESFRKRGQAAFGSEGATPSPSVPSAAGQVRPAHARVVHAMLAHNIARPRFPRLALAY